VHQKGEAGQHLLFADHSRLPIPPAGCFTVHRAANHQHVDKFFATEARKLVDDITAEFAPRLATLTP